MLKNNDEQTTEEEEEGKKWTASNQMSNTIDFTQSF